MHKHYWKIDNTISVQLCDLTEKLSKRHFLNTATQLNIEIRSFELHHMMNSYFLLDSESTILQAKLKRVAGATKMDYILAGRNDQGYIIAAFL